MKERFEKHREFLVDRIDPDFGLLDKLFARRALTKEAVHKIKLKDNTTEDKNRILLDFILKNKKANDLISALKDSGQNHLVNYLNADGDYGSEFRDDWPLSEDTISILAIDRESLVDLLDASDLCTKLFYEKVINNRQKQSISSKPTDSDKNEELLDILTKFSLRQYNMAIACLNNCNKGHIADLLSEGGVFVQLHASLEGYVANIGDLEGDIFSQLTRVLENSPLDANARLLELTRQRIVAIKKEHSIVFYIHCKTNDELLQLTNLLETNTLKETVERVFIEMLSIEDALRVSLTWSSEEFTTAASYFDSDDVSSSRGLQTETTATKFKSFSAALVEDTRDGGQDLVTIRPTYSSLKMSHDEDIEKNNDVLQRCTTINLYVIDYLRAEDVLDEAQEHDLKTERNPLKQRIILYQWLKEVSSKRYQSFLQVMKDVEQEHVANLLIGSTEEDHLPLSDGRHARLMKIRHRMAEVTRIDNEVIAELRSLKAISMTDVEEIRAETVDYARVSKLISAIMRRSNYSYVSFQAALRRTLQTAAAEFLNKGEITAVHLNNNRPKLDGPLSFAFNDLIRNKITSDADINNLLAEVNGFNLDLVTTIPGQSIVIFIYCKTVQNAVKFTQIFNSGHLQYLLHDILSRLLLTIEPGNTKELDSRISLEDEEIICLQEFTGIEGWMTKNLLRPKRFGKNYSCDATSQSDRPRKGQQASRGKSKNLERNSSDIKDSVDVSLSGDLQSRLDVTEGPSLSTSASAMDSRDEDSVDVSLSGDLQSRLEVTKRPSLSTSASVEDSRDEGWTRDSSNRPTNLGKICGCDASTQTDEEPREEMNSARSDDYLSLKRKLQEAQKENDKLKKLLAHQSDKDASKYKSDSALVLTIRTKTSENKHTWVRGFTILDKELFVVSQGLSEVQVYDSMEFSFSRHWNLKELMYPYDIGSCSRLKCLYILDFKGSNHSSEILRVDSNGKLIKKWPIGDDNGWAISVTDESNVILTVTDNSKLKEYSPDGELIREILLSPYSGRPIRHPCHAVKLTTGHFVVSHGYYGDDLHRVCLMDPTGNSKKSFGGKCGSDNGRMNLPIHLAVDENGFVMLVDLWNSRVLLLDSNLKFKRVVLSKARNPELQFPWRILLDESNGRLLVADNERNEGRILIYQFK